MNGVPQTAEIPGMAENFMLKAKSAIKCEHKSGLSCLCRDRLLFNGKIRFDFKIFSEPLSRDFKSSGLSPTGFVYCQYFRSENISAAQIFSLLNGLI